MFRRIRQGRILRRRSRVGVTTELLNDALAISDAWSNQLDLRQLVETQLRASNLLSGSTDVIAIGKAAREMAAAVREVLGDHVRRQLVIVDEGPAFSLDVDVEFVIGEHPLPGLGSLMAGERLIEFLADATSATCTLFLISGGASSLCAFPQSPMELDDLHELFAAALETGANITTLNKLRAASSRIAGGAILRSVRTPRSLSLIMVDNVVSGERWVASGLTYDFEPDRSEVEGLLRDVGCATGTLATTLLDSLEQRRDVMRRAVTTSHENRVIAEPSRVLAAAITEASQRGYEVIDLGSAVHGDVQDVVAQMAAHVQSRDNNDGAYCVVGVGEVTLRVRGSGTGGRCQEFAWRMAEVFDGSEREVMVVARATDGRDFVKGIAGGWTDESTLRRARDRGIEWSRVVEESDSFTALNALDQLIAGGRTGWNLCDVYVVVVAKR
jgi:glycerate 2-kinase